MRDEAMKLKDITAKNARRNGKYAEVLEKKETAKNL